jgi:hypothetical protein
MRTTLDINDTLFVQAKKKAADEGVPLRAIVENALRSYLAGPPSRRRYRLRWTPEKGRLLPGIDLDDRNSLFDAMEGRK